MPTNSYGQETTNNAYGGVSEPRHTAYGGTRPGPGYGSIKIMKPTPPVETFICDVCGATFTKRIALVGHKRSHKE